MLRKWLTRLFSETPERDSHGYYVSRFNLHAAKLEHNGRTLVLQRKEWSSFYSISQAETAFDLKGAFAYIDRKQVLGHPIEVVVRGIAPRHGAVFELDGIVICDRRNFTPDGKLTPAPVAPR